MLFSYHFCAHCQCQLHNQSSLLCSCKLTLCISTTCYLQKSTLCIRTTYYLQRSTLCISTTCYQQKSTLCIRTTYYQQKLTLCISAAYYLQLNIQSSIKHIFCHTHTFTSDSDNMIQKKSLSTPINSRTELFLQ